MARIPEPCSWLPGFEPEPAAAFAPPLPPFPPVPPDPPLDDEPGEEEHEPRPPQPLWRPSEPPTPNAARRPWPPLPAGGLDIPHGAVAKFEANLAAIQTLRTLDSSGSEPDENQRDTLLRYTGWGGLPASFNHEATEPAWSRRATQLRDVLDADDHCSALASVNNSHFTPVAVIAAMWQAVRGFGFTGGRVLEPSAGIGHFLGAMPAALTEQCTVTAIEIDRLSGRMLRALYGVSGVDVRIGAFEKTPLADAWYDLAICNVPFGAYKVADSSNRPYGRFSIHNYFLGRALDLLRPGGLACFITSSHTMDAWDDTVRRHLASQAVLLGAIRLPRGAFAEIASTDVQADILFLRKRVPGEADEQPWAWCPSRCAIRAAANATCRSTSGTQRSPSSASAASARKATATSQCRPRCSTANWPTSCRGGLICCHAACTPPSPRRPLRHRDAARPRRREPGLGVTTSTTAACIAWRTAS
jgi:hypothetical protein